MQKAYLFRRTLDICFSLTALLLLAAPFLLIGLLIKLGSRGPVFFVQDRIGRGGRLFHFYKFRTMNLGTTGPHVTAQDDPRVTPLGRLLRRSKIDELPQLLNILRGDMSIIGPRPEVERFVNYYSAEERQILLVQPGLASMAQVLFPHEAEVLKGSNDPERTYVQELLPKKLAVDLEYERHRTFFSDLGILWNSVLLILGFRNHQALTRSRQDTLSGQNEEPIRQQRALPTCDDQDI